MSLIFGWDFNRFLILSSSDGEISGHGTDGGLFNEFLYNLVWVFCLCNGDSHRIEMRVDGLEDNGECCNIDSSCSPSDRWFKCCQPGIS